MSHSHLSNNLDKIIQLISIEQLMGLMKQMKDTNNISETLSESVSKAVSEVVCDTKSSKDNIILDPNISCQLEKINNTLLLIVDKISSIETEIQLIKQTRQVVNDDCDEEHIKLRIEEKDITRETIAIETLNITDDEEEVVVEESLEEVEEVVEEEEVVVEEKEEVVEEEVVVEEEEVVVEEKEDEEEEEEEEEEESEVEIEDPEPEQVKVVEEQQEPEKVVEEEEEEVFEIEIDDVTYFATHEENGILYEVDKDGDVGKKVGIIKDGEPIFL